MPHRFRPFCTGRFLFGLFVIVVGVLLTLDNLDVLEAERYLRYWPAGLIAIGLAQLVQACSVGGRVGGLIWMGIGTWLLLDVLDLVQVSVWGLWPILLVIVGATMIWRTFVPGWRLAPASETDATVSALAVMSGVERVSASRDFRGGELTAVMGGCEIDLRQASIAGDEAVIEVFAMWGGIELRVPETWVIINEVLPILGGVEQKTRSTAQEGRPRLVVRGTVIMGGVEIKN